MLVPGGARELARTPAGPAAFRHGRHLALQFHPEATPELADRWARQDPSLDALGISPGALAEQSARHGRAARVQAFELFDAWWASARS
jgi:GMP synthase-like glutamine amidotransferase